MGYPYGDTYLEQIQKSEYECKQITNAYWVLAHKYCKDQSKDIVELSVQECFTILGEAIELESEVLCGVVDAYHFMWDVLAELFPEKRSEEILSDANSTNNGN